MASILLASLMISATMESRSCGDWMYMGPALRNVGGAFGAFGWGRKRLRRGSPLKSESEGLGRCRGSKDVVAGGGGGGMSGEGE
jgi:hypothetical protein